jgi:hypothetical protein
MTRLMAGASCGASAGGGEFGALRPSPAQGPTGVEQQLLCIRRGAFGQPGQLTGDPPLSYAWALNDIVLEPYYAAAVRTMAASWRHFAFGTFDPAATITVDKLPGALWVQALSVRIFGWHTWSLVLPQVIEGIAAVLVLYRAVLRLAGPGAATIAALVLAVSPAVVGLNRANIPDTLMILLLVLATDAAATAAVSGRQRGLALAAVWVGLAFEGGLGPAMVRDVERRGD